MLPLLISSRLCQAISAAEVLGGAITACLVGCNPPLSAAGCWTYSRSLTRASCSLRLSSSYSKQGTPQNPMLLLWHLDWCTAPGDRRQDTIEALPIKRQKVFCMPTSAFNAVSRALFLSWVAIAVDLLRSRLQHTQDHCGSLHLVCPFALRCI